MLKNKILVPGLIAAVAFSASLAIAASGISLEGVKCIIATGRDAKESKSAEWKEGKVFFCCGNCQGKFKGMSDADKEKMAHKANAQLVASKQYKQGACPFSGGDLNEETTIKVAGAEVSFCCNNCKGKAEGMEGEEQVKALFGEKSFKKAKFTKVEDED